MKCWLFANLFSIIVEVRQLISMQKSASYYKKLIREAPEKKEMFKKKFEDMEKQKWKCIRNLLKSGSDFLTSVKGAGKRIELLIDFRVC